MRACLPMSVRSTRLGVRHREWVSGESRRVIEWSTMKIRPVNGECRVGRGRKWALSTATATALLAAALMTPSAASAATAVGHYDPYGSSLSSNPYTSTTSTPVTSTSDTSTPVTSTSDTSTPVTSTSDTSTPVTSTSDTSTPVTSTSDTTSSDTTTPDTSTSETTSTTSTTSPTTSSSTTPAELAVFDPGPCVGAYVTASGSGFTPGEPITVQRDGVVIVTVPAGADGTFSTRVDIEGVQNGDHAITATGTLSGFSATEVFDVEPQICTTDGTVATPATVSAVVLYSVAGTNGGTTVVGLASTGFPVGSALAGAALALMVGTMLLVAARNRRGARAAGGLSDDGPRHL